MQLTHEFTVPASVEDTWEALGDIASVGTCFPGAKVESVSGDSFAGSCKVKLGPIAMVYNGTGTFVEKDPSSRTMKVEARGKDRRGNGTAGADVVVTLAEGGEGTAVHVLTDLSITGKPAQFGRGVMQDVSDKLLAQFVDCLQTKVGGPAADPAEPSAAPTTAPPVGEPAAAPTGEPPVPPARATPTADEPSEPPAAPDDDDALDLGAAVLPVLLRAYGRQLAAVAAVLVVLALLRRLLPHSDSSAV